MDANETFDKDIEVFWHLIFEIVADMEKRITAHMAMHQLTPPQFYVLKTLVEHDGRCRIGQIADEHHLTNATMTGLVKRLEAMRPALVVRQRSDDDGRAVDVVLTDAGRERYQAVFDSFLVTVRTLLQLLPEDERKDIIGKVQNYFTMLRDLFPVATPEAESEASTK